MMLFTKAIREKLALNGLESFHAEGGVDHKPVVKLFTPWGGGTWLISEMHPEDNDLLFGLCDLGMGEPELGNVRLTELTALKGPFGLRIERDRGFKGTKPLGQYADEARAKGRIVV